MMASFQSSILSEFILFLMSFHLPARSWGNFSSSLKLTVEATLIFLLSWRSLKKRKTITARKTKPAIRKYAFMGTSASKRINFLIKIQSHLKRLRSWSNRYSRLSHLIFWGIMLIFFSHLKQQFLAESGRDNLQSYRQTFRIKFSRNRHCRQSGHF